ncbi:uncharacterized protein BXZ73DRAFT_75831 [Epithele typhae]|uniref:uncharacterized protein n=1 Tax=Epithele typhae TaxID=378194 RepID=UPI0020075654|nr:uncharacterized protein BXZ73DRAFT_75831 [Epithele typhae]KAH9939627.1 hypothetical protein BXZ73DRAFT_75831 [Epithele typhae]
MALHAPCARADDSISAATRTVSRQQPPLHLCIWGVACCSLCAPRVTTQPASELAMACCHLEADEEVDAPKVSCEKRAWQGLAGGMRSRGIGAGLLAAPGLVANLFDFGCSAKYGRLRLGNDHRAEALQAEVERLEERLKKQDACGGENKGLREWIEHLVQRAQGTGYETPSIQGGGDGRQSHIQDGGRGAGKLRQSFLKAEDSGYDLVLNTWWLVSDHTDSPSPTSSQLMAPDVPGLLLTHDESRSLTPEEWNGPLAHEDVPSNFEHQRVDLTESDLDFDVDLFPPPCLCWLPDNFCGPRNSQ